jgi:hypothetical protein
MISEYLHGQMSSSKRLITVGLAQKKLDDSKIQKVWDLLQGMANNQYM